MNFRQGSDEPSEIVLRLIGPIGCNRQHVCDTIEHLTKHYSYKTKRIRVSELIEENSKITPSADDQYARVSNLIAAGNELRKRTGDNSILEKLSAEKIARLRPKDDQHETSVSNELAENSIRIVWIHTRKVVRNLAFNNLIPAYCLHSNSPPPIILHHAELLC